MTAQQSRQIRSTITAESKLRLNLETTSVPAPQANEVLILVQATPINPSDLGLLIGPADVGSLQVSGSADDPVVTMDVPKAMLPALAARLNESMPVGNEG
ncbi:MAG: NADH oxidase, partial [Pseudohongiella sp.]